MANPDKMLPPQYRAEFSNDRINNAVRRETRDLLDAITILRKENEDLREKQRRTAARSNRRKKQLRIFNRHMRDLSTAKRLEEKFERLIRDIIGRYFGDKQEDIPDIAVNKEVDDYQFIESESLMEKSGVTEPQPIAAGNLSVVTESPETIIEPTEPPIQTRGRAMWRNKIDITRPAAVRVKHTDDWVCPDCGFSPCRCEEAFRENV